MPMSLAPLRGLPVNILNFGADPTGATLSDTAWSQALDAAVGKTLFLPTGTYKLSATKILTLTGTGITIISDNATLVLANGSIVNTDASPNNSVWPLQVRGCDYFNLLGVLTCDGNRDGQTYPETNNAFGVGLGRFFMDAFIGFCSDGTNRSKNIFIERAKFNNCYMSGLGFCQTDNINATIEGEYNTWNLAGGRGINNANIHILRDYRNGHSSTFTAVRQQGDRAGFQVRYLAGSFTTANCGYPVIDLAGEGEVNHNINVVSEYAEECQLHPAFFVGVVGGTIHVKNVKNIGWNRTDDPAVTFDASPNWMEGSGAIVQRVDNFVQTADNSASGWRQPEGVVAYPLQGNAGTDNRIQGKYSSMVRIGQLSSGQDWSSVGDYSLSANKKNNIKHAVRCTSNVDAEVSFAEGLSSSMFRCSNQQPVSATHDWMLPSNLRLVGRLTNSTAAPAGVYFWRWSTGTGDMDFLDIDIEADDLRTTSTSQEGRAIVGFDSELNAFAIKDGHIRVKAVGSNSADSSKKYCGVALTSAVGSRIHFDVTLRNGYAPVYYYGTGSADLLDLERINAPGCDMIFQVNQQYLSSPIELMRVRNVVAQGLTSKIGMFGNSAGKVKNLVLDGLDVSGSIGGQYAMNDFMQGVNQTNVVIRGLRNAMRKAFTPTAPMNNGTGYTFPATIEGVPGAVFPNIAQRSYDAPLAGVWLVTYVSSNSVLYGRFHNLTGGTVSPSSGNLRFRIRQQRKNELQAFYSAAPGSISSGASVTASATVPGAKLGDFVLVGYGATLGPSSAHCRLVGNVSAADTVLLTFANASAATSNLSSALANILVIPYETAVKVGTATYDPPSMANNTSASTTVSVSGLTSDEYLLVSSDIDLQGITLQAEYESAGVARVYLYNRTGGTLDLGSMTLRVASDIGYSGDID